MQRRKFIKSSGLISASLFVPQFLRALQHDPIRRNGQKVLVVLQLSGGNDSLNTVIPVRSDVYYRSRPRLSIKQADALNLTDEASINPALPFFKTLYDSGELAILNSVGYPNPDRSHFRSLDIWQSASDSSEYLQTGWIGRYLDANCKGCDRPTGAIEFDDVLSLALKGENLKGIAVRNIRRLHNSAGDAYYHRLADAEKLHENFSKDDPRSYLYKTLSETLSSSEYLYRQSLVHPSSTSYPDTEIGNSFKQIASLILSDIDTRIYYLSLGSFDTHIGQEGQQKRLFHQLNQAVESFVKDLKQNQCFEHVLLTTFSEFGRRVSQNASGGTDHGAAGNMFFIGGGLKQKGLLNELPNLTDLENGDVRYTVDFRNVYATLLKRWLETDDVRILGRKYQHLSFV